jgi:hypothetical protein
MKIAALMTALLLAAALSAPSAAQDNGPAPAASAADVAAPGVAPKAADKPKDKDSAHAPAAKLYAPAAQLVNWPMQILVSPDLPEGATPTLTLLISHGHTDAEVGACANIPLQFSARNQTWVGGADTDGANAQHVGTLLLYDLSSTRCKLDPVKPMTRVRPILDWTPQDKACADCKLIGTSLINLGNATTAFIEALVAVALGVLLVVGLARIGRHHKLIELFFSVDDGKLSLSMLQMALWTLAAVLMVIFEDLLRLDTPTVPSSIVVLMGMSLLTTGFSYHLTANPPSGKPPAVAPAAAPVVAVGAPLLVPGGPVVVPVVVVPPTASRLSDLLCVPDANGVMQLSLSRAQMLLWTLVMVVLFIAKSAINQSLWEIPWALVALMGVSQAGYLGGKFSQ